MKINSNRKLQNIAINHSANIDYKYVMNFIENSQKNHILFWQLIQHCLRVILEDLGKIWFSLLKMTVTDQIKILYDKIKSNQAQYDLSKEATRISVLSFKNLLDKYGYSI